MWISPIETMRFLNLLEQEISNLQKHYNELGNSIARCQLPKTDWFYKEAGLMVEEMKDLQESFKERQHQLYTQWYLLNDRCRNSGESYSTKSFRGTIIEEVRAYDVVERYKKELNKC